MEDRVAEEISFLITAIQSHKEKPFDIQVSLNNCLKYFFDRFLVV